MVNIRWCLRKAKGIRLVEPSELICKDYIRRSESDIKAIFNNEGHWKIVAAYYACYDVLYAFLMKLGIKSEIHECTIALMELLKFGVDDINFIRKTER